MSSEPDQTATQPAAAPTTAYGESPLSVDTQASDPFEERPELFVAGAFVGGVVLAQILRRLGP